MKDIHSHLLYGIDDGTSSIKESINIIKKLYSIGFTDLILTPHYIEETNYNADNKEKEARLEYLKEALLKENIDINLYLGNEIFITNNISELLKRGEVSTLVNSRYILIEFSLYHQLSNDRDILLDLINEGYTPILAHPERYEYYQDDINYFKDLVNRGVLLQGNLLSLVDTKKKRKLLTKLLKENLIHFLGTDIHKIEDIELLDKSLMELKKIVSKEKQKELLDTNIIGVIEDSGNRIFLY
jgi:protein-tyrosine phosphatase